MQLRLQFRDGSKNIKNFLLRNNFDTGDAFITHPNSDVKVVLDCPTLREMTPESQMNEGALVISEDIY